MKTLLLFPPQWTPISPHFALPSLVGQLKANGFSAKGIDLNIDFYNKILKSDFIKNSVMRAIDNNKNVLGEIAPYIQAGVGAGKSFEDYPLDIQNKIVKYSKVKEFAEKKQKLLLEIPDLAENAVQILKSEDFYTPEMLIKAVNIIDSALEMASMPYFPSKISLDSYSNPLFKLTFEHMKFFVFDEATNIFIEYYKSILDEILSENADYIGISINSTGQIIPGLTLANLLKTKAKAHVNIGGNFFGRVKDSVIKNPEFFGLFCDSLLVEEGERPVVELAKYIAGEIKINEVSNLIYKNEDGKVVINETKKPLKLDEMSIVSLDGYDFTKYFAPEIILPFQSSRGCYWGKCSFCDQDFGQNFNVKNVEKLTDEFIELKEKYGIKYFEFIDESVSPAYLAELSEKIKEKEIDIKYFFDARLEKTFTKEILQKGYNSGLKMVLWGLESGSKSVMELINKGIDIDLRLEILKNSSDVGLWNFAFIFFGFPTETVEDARKTIEMLCENNDIIHSYGRSVFTMGKHTKLKDEPEKYGITAVYPALDEFSPTYTFDCTGMAKDELNLILKECTKACASAYNDPLWMYLRYREYLFLYIAKYGKDWVLGYKINKENL